MGKVHQAFADSVGWLERIDPGAHRRIKGLRLVTAYGIAAMLGTLPDITQGLADGKALNALAGGFALWASVSEARTTRLGSTRDLVLLSVAAVVGAISFIGLAPLLHHLGRAWPELTLATGAFFVGYLRRFGITGAGIGSQIYIGQLLAYGAGLDIHDVRTIVTAGLLAALAAIVPRLLSGRAEHPPPISTALQVLPGRLSPELAMGLQASAAAVFIVALNAIIGLAESAWAITACTYVISGSTTGTIDRAKRRIVGTLIGVPLGLVVVSLSVDLPLAVWTAAAMAMIIYAMALPERYDIASGAFAFTLMLTLAVAGQHSFLLLASRIWETIIGGAVGLASAMLLFPLRTQMRDKA